MTNGYRVFCEICGLSYDERDPEVRWLNIDQAWTCADETACFERKATATVGPMSWPHREEGMNR